MKAIDLFCGAGGLTRGLRRAGWDVVAGIDADPYVAETYRRNNPDATFVNADLRAVTEDDIRAVARGIPRRKLLLAGCAPCQPFSKQLRGCGPAQRSDATLLLEFARLVRALRPGAVLMENVPGVAAEVGPRSLSFFLETLVDYGYGYDQSVLNACDFGVPQHRRRYVLLALRDAPASLPQGVEGHASQESRTVRQAIARFPEIRAGQSHQAIPNHYAAKLSARNMERIKATPRDGGSRKDWPTELSLACHGRTDVGIQRRLRQNVVGPRGADAHEPMQQFFKWTVRTSRAGPSNQPARGGRVADVSGRLRVLRVEERDCPMDPGTLCQFYLARLWAAPLRGRSGDAVAAHRRRWGRGSWSPRGHGAPIWRESAAGTRSLSWPLGVSCIAWGTAIVYTDATCRERRTFACPSAGRQFLLTGAFGIDTRAVRGVRLRRLVLPFGKTSSRRTSCVTESV